MIYPLIFIIKDWFDILNEHVTFHFLGDHVAKLQNKNYKVKII